MKQKSSSNGAIYKMIYKMIRKQLDLIVNMVEAVEMTA